VEVPDEDLGRVVMQNVVPRLSLTPGAIRHSGPATLGRDQEYVEGIIRQFSEGPTGPRRRRYSEEV